MPQQASARDYYSSTHIFRGTVGDPIDSCHSTICGDPKTTGGGGAVWGAESTFTTVCSTQNGIQFVGPRLAATPFVLIGQASVKYKV